MADGDDRHEDRDQRRRPGPRRACRSPAARRADHAEPEEADGHRVAQLRRRQRRGRAGRRAAAGRPSSSRWSARRPTKPGDGRAPAGGVARRRRARRATSVATTPTLTAICSATASSARSTATPATAPGQRAAPRITQRTRATPAAGGGRSSASVSRFDSRAEQRSAGRPPRSGSTAANSERRGDQREAEAGRGLQRRPGRDARRGGDQRHAAIPQTLIQHAVLVSLAWPGTSPPSLSSRSSSTGCATFVRDEVWPIETVFDELGQDGFVRAIAPLQEQVRERGLWAAHLPPDLGGQGFGQVKLGLMHEILGSSPFAPFVFGNEAPDSGNSEVLALAGTEDQKQQWLHPLLAGDLRSAFSMTEPEHRGQRPDAARRRARCEDGDDVGHQRPQVVLHQRLGGGLPDRDGRHRPRRAPVPARVDVHRAGRHAGRADRARRADDGAPVRALRRATAGTPRSSTRTCGCPRTRCSARAAPAS